MRCRWIVLGVLSASCLLAGCDSGGGTSTATPENPQAGLEVLKKWQTKPRMKVEAPPPSQDKKN
jgi:hypothetical protein